ncbi:MAG: integrase core domain-containing protein, partial [Phycisphaerae bacterium]
LWQRLTLLAATTSGARRRLDSFAAWYNTKRPHSALGVRTPHEAFADRKLPKPVPIRSRDGPKVEIHVARRHFRGDTRLPVIEINLRQAA